MADAVGTPRSQLTYPAGHPVTGSAPPLPTGTAALQSPTDALLSPISRAIRKRNRKVGKSLLREPAALPIVLGSASTARRRVLVSAGVDFSVQVADIDERAIRDSEPETLVVKIAQAKAAAIRQRYDHACVLITADQVVVGSDGVVREKPLNEPEAREMLASYAGSFARTVSSVVVTNTRTGACVHGVDVCTITFRDSLRDEGTVSALLRPCAPIACLPAAWLSRVPPRTSDPAQLCNIYTAAGALMIEHPAMQAHIVDVAGDVDSIQGLPWTLLCKLVAQVSSLRLDDPGSSAAGADATMAKRATTMATTSGHLRGLCRSCSGNASAALFADPSSTTAVVAPLPDDAAAQPRSSDPASSSASASSSECGGQGCTCGADDDSEEEEDIGEELGTAPPGGPAGESGSVVAAGEGEGGLPPHAGEGAGLHRQTSDASIASARSAF